MSNWVIIDGEMTEQQWESLRRILTRRKYKKLVTQSNPPDPRAYKDGYLGG